MIPFASVLPILGSAFRLLASGGKVDAGVWGSEVSNVLSALLAESDQTSAALSRIEAKLEDLSLQAFRNSFGAAMKLMQEATPEWRDAGDRERLIAEARSRLIDALATEPDPLARAMVEWYLGVAWLLSGSTKDCERTMRAAAGNGFASMLGIVQDWRAAPDSTAVRVRARELESGVDRLNRRLLGGSGSREAISTATWQVRRGLAPYAEDLEATLQGIQRTRKTLGSDPIDCPEARFGPPVSGRPGTGSSDRVDPKLIVDVARRHPVRFGEIEVGVGGLKVSTDLPAFDGSLVDAEIKLARSASVGPIDIRLSVLDEMQATHWIWSAGEVTPAPPFVGTSLKIVEDQEIKRLDNLAVARMLPLAGRALMANDPSHPAQRRIRLETGQARKGWLRFACAERPAAIVVTPVYDSGAQSEDVHFIRTL